MELLEQPMMPSDEKKDATKLDTSPTEATTPEEEMEQHRPLIREVDRSLGTTYGYGGGAVLLAVAAVLLGGWWTVGLVSGITWLSAITVALIGLFVVRSIVRRRARRLYDRVQAYCRANDIDVERLRSHYRGEDFYDFFEALFELEERRRRLEGSDGDEDTADADREQ
jgi:uncharacterized membrane protein